MHRVVSLALVLTLMTGTAVAAAPARVSFADPNFTVSEAAGTVRIGVRLDAPATQRLVVAVRVSDMTATADSEGTGADYAVPTGSVTFAVGEQTTSLDLVVYNDAYNEIDERLEVALVPSADLTAAPYPACQITIVDDDRAGWVDVVRDFGAIGDGVTDDTPAIQAAIDHLAAGGGGVLVFPAGTYSVTSVTLREGITYQGLGAIIKRPPLQGKWVRTFTTQGYASPRDARPIVIKGLTFDGNSPAQGSYQGYELEQAHLIFLAADPAQPGRIVAVVEDCQFRHGVGDGVSVYTNAVVTMARCVAEDVFRGGFVLTGGNSTVRVSHLTTRGRTDPTGIDIEVDGPGWGGTYRVDAQLRDVQLEDGDFDIAVRDSSRVRCERVVAPVAPFFLYALDSEVVYRDCLISVGAADGYGNRIVFPGRTLFDRCQLRALRAATGRPASYYAAADVWWELGEVAPANQSLEFRNCRFAADSAFVAADKVYGVVSRANPNGRGNSLRVDGGCFGPGFDRAISIPTGGVVPESVAAGCDQATPTNRLLLDEGAPGEASIQSSGGAQSPVFAPGGPAYQGSSSAALTVKPAGLGGWTVSLQPAAGTTSLGYRALRLALNQGTASGRSLTLAMGGTSVGLVPLDTSKVQVDRSQPGWLLLEIPFTRLGFVGATLDEIRFSGTLTGTLYLDAVQLVADPSSTAVSSGHEARPGTPGLGRSYPNPFNAATCIPFALTAPGWVELTVHNLAGQRVATLVDQFLPAGPQLAAWNGEAHGRPVASGVYVCRLRCGSATWTRALICLR